MKNKKFDIDGSNGKYYDIPKEAEQLQDLIELRNMNFAMGNIFKAAFRIGNKKGVDEVYDLEKIIFFAKRELKRISKKAKGR